jgi:hypothetical protein
MTASDAIGTGGIGHVSPIADVRETIEQPRLHQGIVD